MPRNHICLSLMMRNEINYVRRTIESVIPYIDCWTAVDTGSTDGTQDLVRDLLKNLPGTLHEMRWRDWGWNRTQSINLAKQSGAEFILIVDADQELHLDEMPELDPDVFYWTPVHVGETVYSRGNLISTKHDWHYVGVTHEYLTAAPKLLPVKFLPGYLLIHPDRVGTTIKRCTEDARLLENALKEDPNNLRNMHFLAQSYVGMGELKKALDAYEKRVRMGTGEPEELWFSYFQIANIRRVLDYPRDAVIQAFLRAHDLRPTRAEADRSLAIYLNAQADKLPLTTDTWGVYPDAYKREK